MFALCLALRAEQSEAKNCREWGSRTRSNRVPLCTNYAIPLECKLNSIFERGFLSEMPPAPMGGEGREAVVLRAQRRIEESGEAALTLIGFAVALRAEVI